MQSFPNYAYYPYPQTPHANTQNLRSVPNGYQQYYQQVPAHPGHMTVPYDQYPAAYPNATASHPVERPRSHRRNNTVPLRSVLKQPSNPAPGPTNDPNSLTRQRTGSSTGHVALGRTRTQSNPKASDVVSGRDYNFVPLHMFISFRNSNEIRFENIPQPAVNELESKLQELWPPGADHQTVGVGDWVVRFREAPWEMKTHVKEARQIILNLFTLFARRGYVFRTAINLRDQFPRLVFEATATDPNSEFFLAYFSKSGRQFNLVNPPSHIDLALGAYLKQALPHRIARDEIEEDNIRAIELKKKRYSAPVVEPSLYMMHIFRILIDMGFSLYASVPLARSGILSFMSHQEILVFKGHSPQS
ncbi:hypothetical protein APHAL10511_006390 [Amanita phalloides]|nr:hypothetical protein APHAL10511_006390 [Amanita phalloides]